VNLRKLGMIGAVALTLVLSFATLGRVLIWQDEETIVVQGVAQHPESLRAKLDLVSLRFRSHDYANARAINEVLLQSTYRQHRLAGHLQAVTISCLDGSGSSPHDLRQAADQAMTRFTVSELRLVRTMFNLTKGRDCGKVTSTMMADAVVAMLAAAPTQSDNASVKYVANSYAARLYARDGRWIDAEARAEITWKYSRHLPDAALLARIYIQNGKFRQAEQLVNMLDQSIEPSNEDGRKSVIYLRKLLEKSPSAPMFSS
jgi:protein O-mannosyl-transferase